MHVCIYADRPAEEPGLGINDSTCQEFAFSSIRLIFRPFGNTRPPDWQLLVAEPGHHDFLGVSLTSLLENRYQPLKGTSWTYILFRLDDPRSISSWYMEYIFLNVARCDTFRLLQADFSAGISGLFRLVSFRFVLYTLPSPPTDFDRHKASDDEQRGSMFFKGLW